MLIFSKDNSIILKKLNQNELYKELKKLILNPNKRQSIQINSYKNVKHITSKNSHLIDEIRESLFNNFNLNILKKKLRIINIYIDYS